MIKKYYEDNLSSWMSFSKFLKNYEKENCDYSQVAAEIELVVANA